MKVALLVSKKVGDVTEVGAALIASGFDVTELVLNGDSPADDLGQTWANRRGVVWKRFCALWGQYHERAGVLRDNEIMEYAEAFVAVYDGECSQTWSWIRRLRKAGKTVYVWETDHGL